MHMPTLHVYQDTHIPGSQLTYGIQLPHKTRDAVFLFGTSLLSGGGEKIQQLHDQGHENNSNRNMTDILLTGRVKW